MSGQVRTLSPPLPELFSGPHAAPLEWQPLAVAPDKTGDKTKDTGSIYKYLSVFSEPLHLVRQAYVDDTASETLMANAMAGVPDALDPFSLYIPADQFAAYARAAAVGRSRSGLRLVKERGFAVVIGIGDGSPAQKAGLELGDLVSKIDGRPTRIMPLWELVEVFAGAPGAKIELELIHRAEPKKVTFTLADWSAPGPRVEELRGGAMLLRIADIDEKTVAATESALRDLGSKKITKLMIDLRDTSGIDAGSAYPAQPLRGELGAHRAATRSPRPIDRRSTEGRFRVPIVRGTLRCRRGPRDHPPSTAGVAGGRRPPVTPAARRWSTARRRQAAPPTRFSGPDKKPRVGLQLTHRRRKILSFAEKDAAADRGARARAAPVARRRSLPAKKAA